MPTEMSKRKAPRVSICWVSSSLSNQTSKMDFLLNVAILALLVVHVDSALNGTERSSGDSLNNLKDAPLLPAEPPSSSSASSSSSSSSSHNGESGPSPGAENAPVLHVGQGPLNSTTLNQTSSVPEALGELTSQHLSSSNITTLSTSSPATTTTNTTTTTANTTTTTANTTTTTANTTTTTTNTTATNTTTTNTTATNTTTTTTATNTTATTTNTTATTTTTPTPTNTTLNTEHLIPSQTLSSTQTPTISNQPNPAPTNTTKTPTPTPSHPPGPASLTSSTNASLIHTTNPTKDVPTTQQPREPFTAHPAVATETSRAGPISSTTTPTNSSAAQATAHANTPSPLSVGEAEKPLVAGLVSAFVVTAVVITLLLFLKLRRRDNRPQFHRLQDLPMDDMMEDTPLSMYSY